MNLKLISGVGIVSLAGYFLFTASGQDKAEQFFGSGGVGTIGYVKPSLFDSKTTTTTTESPLSGESSFSTFDTSSKKADTIETFGKASTSSGSTGVYSSTGKLSGVEDPVSSMSRYPTKEEVSKGSPIAYSPAPSSLASTPKKSLPFQIPKIKNPFRRR